jgi:cytidine deaminase
MILFEVLNFAIISVAALFCTLTKKYAIISQTVPILHVSTLPCLPQGACNQYLAKLHNKCTIISQIIPLLHVSTLSCNPWGACNQYLVKLHNKTEVFFCAFSSVVNQTPRYTLQRRATLRTLTPPTAHSNQFQLFHDSGR